MTFFSRHRKIILLAAVLLVVLVGFGLNTKVANAQLAQSLAGTAVSAFAKTAQTAAGIGIVYAILWVMNMGLVSALAITAFLLDNLASFNLTWNLTSQPLGLIANQGWTVMRDLSNGVFILILLWIAITFVFNLENLGGKKFLIRVIIVALLINFSFAMVSAVFGFANILTKPFYDPLKISKDRGISSIIVGNSYIFEVAKQISQDEIDQLKTRLEKESRREPVPNESMFASLWRSFGAPQEAHADFGITALTIIGVALVSALAGALVSIGTGYVLFPLILNLIIANIFLALMTVAFATISVILALRLIAIVLLAVFAPVAFLGFMTPKYGERFWNEWLHYLFNWAFIAPVFFFLLYLSLLMLTTLTQALQNTGFQSAAFNGNLLKMLNLSIFLIMLFATIRITRKMGGAIAETALTLGKQVAGFGLGVVTGGAAGLFAAGARRAGGQRLKEIMQKTPILRSTVLARRYGAYVEGQKARLAPHEAELKDASDDRLLQEYRAALRAERKAAIAGLLASRGKFGKLEASEQTDALRLAAQFGPQNVQTILKARPDLANANNVSVDDIKQQKDKALREGRKISSDNEAAQIAILSKIRSDDIIKMSDEVFDTNTSDPETNEKNRKLMAHMWQTFTPALMGRLAQDKSHVMGNMHDVLETNTDIALSPNMYNYLASNTAQGLGMGLPANMRRPQALVSADMRKAEQELREKQEEIGQLGEKADLFNARGMSDEVRSNLNAAKAVIEKQIPVAEQKVKNLKQELDTIEAQRAEAIRRAGGIPPPPSTPTPPKPRTPEPGPNPLGDRASITATDIPPQWIDNELELLRNGYGTPLQKIIYESKIPDSEKRQRLAEDLAYRYKTGKR